MLHKDLLLPGVMDVMDVMDKVLLQEGGRNLGGEVGGLILEAQGGIIVEY